MVLRRALGVLVCASCGPAEVGWSALPSALERVDDDDGCSFVPGALTFLLAPVALPAALRAEEVRWPEWPVGWPSTALDYGPSVTAPGARYAEVRLGVSAMQLEGSLACDALPPVALSWSGRAAVDRVCAGSALASADGSTTRFGLGVALGWPWGDAPTAREVWTAATAQRAAGAVTVDLDGLVVASEALGPRLAAQLPAALTVQGADCALASDGASD